MRILYWLLELATFICFWFGEPLELALDYGFVLTGQIFYHLLDLVWNDLSHLFHVTFFRRKKTSDFSTVLFVLEQDEFLMGMVAFEVGFFIKENILVCHGNFYDVIFLLNYIEIVRKFKRIFHSDHFPHLSPIDPVSPHSFANWLFSIVIKIRPNPSAKILNLMIMQIEAMLPHGDRLPTQRLLQLMFI